MIKAVFDSIDSAGGSVNQSAERVQGLLDQLGRDLGPLMQDWGGNAYSLYAEKQAQWNKLAQELQDIQRLIAKHMIDSAQGYRDTDLICAKTWGG